MEKSYIEAFNIIEERLCSFELAYPLGKYVHSHLNPLNAVKLTI